MWTPHAPATPECVAPQVTGPLLPEALHYAVLQYACQFRQYPGSQTVQLALKVVQCTRVASVPRQSHFSFVKIQFARPVGGSAE